MTNKHTAAAAAAAAADIEAAAAEDDASAAAWSWSLYEPNKLTAQHSIDGCCTPISGCTYWSGFCLVPFLNPRPLHTLLWSLVLAEPQKGSRRSIMSG